MQAPAKSANLSKFGPSMRARVCSTPEFVLGLYAFLGVRPEQLQHYPWVRQTSGPAAFLDRATFDCSERAPLQLRFVGIEVRVLRPVRVCLDAVALRLRVERQAGKVCSQKT